MNILAPPSPPQNLRVIDVTSKSVTIEWEPPSSNGGAEITGYIIEKYLTKSSQWSRIATLDPHCTNYCIDNLKEKKGLIFRVSAENSIGIGAPTATENIALKSHASKYFMEKAKIYKKCNKIFDFSAVPSPPTGPLETRLTATYANVVEWGIPESDGGAPLEGYKIAIRDIKKTMWMEVGLTGPEVQKFNLRDLQEGHDYLIRIFASNEIGLSDPLELEEPYKVIHTNGEKLSFEL